LDEVEGKLMVSNGGPSIDPHQEPRSSPRSPSPSSKVKEKIQALIDQLAVLRTRSTSLYKPSFVYLLEGDLDGSNFLRAPPSFSLGSQVSKKPSCSSFGCSNSPKTEAMSSCAQSSALDFEDLIG